LATHTQLNNDLIEHQWQLHGAKWRPHSFIFIFIYSSVRWTFYSPPNISLYVLSFDWNCYCNLSETIIVIWMILVWLYFYLKNLRTRYNTDTYKHAHTLTPMNAICTSYHYEHLWRTEPTDLEVDEVTTYASLLTDTSPTTEKIAPDNRGINIGKCKRPFQI
jgi:hypothetical protein